MRNKKTIPARQKNRVLIGGKSLENSSFAGLAFPFSAIVGQEQMKLALLLTIVDPSIGGALLMGHRGTGKSTAVRALADLLPPITKVRGCLYGCDPSALNYLCADCRARSEAKGKLPGERAHIPVVDLPLGATEDRVCGTIDIERALTKGEKAFEPGLLARANRGLLYVDEVNLLEDHLVDLLLDVAVTGINKVEREGISVEHPSRFVLIGSGNPEEGELRPQLIDRFGLHVDVQTEQDMETRAEIVERRQAFELDPEKFVAATQGAQNDLRKRIVRAQKNLPRVKMPRSLLRRIAKLCGELKIDGHRGELTITRAARALAALEGRREVSENDVRRVAAMSLRHRLRRGPLDSGTGTGRLEQAVENMFPEAGSKKRSAPGRRVSSSPDFDNGNGRSTEPTARENGAGGAADYLLSKSDLPTPAAVETKLPEMNADVPANGRAPQAKRNGPSSTRRPLSRSVYDSRGGRYARTVSTRIAGSRLALDATLRAAALQVINGRRQTAVDSSQKREGGIDETGGGSQRIANAKLRNACCVLPLGTSALRFKRFKRKAGTLFIIAVDTSGSMALNRINQAKGAVAQLLRQSYVRRDRVALVSFRGQQAEVLMPPSQSVTRAGRILNSLRMGGATPLASALARSLEIATRAARNGSREIKLLVFTDGRANVSLQSREGFAGSALEKLILREIETLAAAFAKISAAMVVVDTQNGFQATGKGPALAQAMGAQYATLPLPAASKSDGLGNGSRTGSYGVLADLAANLMSERSTK